jgi:hypothetical protein
MGNYHPINEIGTQTKKNMLSSKFRKPEVIDRFKMAAAAMLELLCYEIITGLDENGRLAKQNMLIECKSHKSGSLRQKNSKN